MIDLEIGDHRIRVVVDDAAAGQLLRDALDDHLRDAEHPIGFVLSRPTDDQGFYVVKDRSGYVLGRSRRLEQAVAVLGGHLAALRPGPPGTVRARLRALVAQDGSVTCAAWPLLFSPPVVERRLVAMGYAMIDQLVVDIDRRAYRLLPEPVPWPLLAGLDPGDGHARPSGALPITSLLLPELPGMDEITVARTVSWLTPLLAEPDRVARLDVVECFVSRLNIAQVPLGDPGSVYRALVQTTS